MRAAYLEGSITEIPACGRWLEESIRRRTWQLWEVLAGGPVASKSKITKTVFTFTLPGDHLEVSQTLPDLPTTASTGGAGASDANW